jgi:hypothetical protein
MSFCRCIDANDTDSVVADDHVDALDVDHIVRFLFFSLRISTLRVTFSADNVANVNQPTNKLRSSATTTTTSISASAKRRPLSAVFGTPPLLALVRRDAIFYYERYFRIR